ncbi:hypothetical protein BKA62DRAFT_207127 [Auriculariales sp. MPI-PUGE-AT-0066]|nr:hypothetical protein BKA62DRAFT_207127 [Auriculariales sp. MPI-PUGE-AT-0066]
MPSFLPDDVLLYIFGQAVDRGDITWPKTDYSREFAAAPFKLAAVCPRWRTLARATCSLWTYFGFPGHFESHHAHLPRLEILLALSKEAPIDLELVQRHRGHGSGNLEMEELFDRHPQAFKLVQILATLVRRCRTLVLDVSTGMTAVFFSASSSDTWPYLEFLSVRYTNRLHGLPHLPRLLCMHLGYCSMTGLRDALTQLPSLTTLTILQSDGEEDTHALLRAVSLQLTDLCLLGFPEGSADEPLVFPRLRSLTLNDSFDLHHFRAPALQRLALDLGNLNNDVLSATQHVASVKHLQIWGAVDFENLVLLQDLRQISRLTFAVAAEVGWIWKESYHLSANLFQVLSAVVPPMWPLLKRIDFCSMDTRSTSSQSHEGLLKFIASRQNRGNALATEPTVARIHEVHLDYHRNREEEMRSFVLRLQDLLKDGTLQVRPY